MNSVGQVARVVRGTLDALLGTLFPAFCVGCAQPLPAIDRRGSICARCFEELPRLAPPLCARCGEPHGAPGADLDDEPCARCREHPPRFDRLRSGGSFEGGLRHAVLALKFVRHDFLARHLAVFALGSSEVADVLAGGPTIVPVPMHWRKRRARGYNPADLLARELARSTNGHFAPLLVKLRPTSSQSALSLRERRANVCGSVAFRRPSAFSRRLSSLGRVVLVDDVATSLETLEESSRALQEGGVREIDAVTVARAIRHVRPEVAGVLTREPSSHGSDEPSSPPRGGPPSLGRTSRRGLRA